METTMAKPDPVADILAARPPLTLEEIPDFPDAKAAEDWIVKVRKWRRMGVPGSPNAKYLRPDRPASGEAMTTQKVYQRYAPDGKLLPQVWPGADGKLKEVRQPIAIP